MQESDKKEKFVSKYLEDHVESICIEDRKKLTISGATKVVSATDTQAVVEVGGTNVVISGSDIEVTKLDLDNKSVCFSGNINGVKYTQKVEKGNFVKRLFK